MVAAYNKGWPRSPRLVLMIVFTFMWYLCGVERRTGGGDGRHPAHRGMDRGARIVRRAVLAPWLPRPPRHRLPLGAVIATVANDIGALAFGAWWGARWPRISPNKTWEGLFGGRRVTVVVAAVVVGAIHPGPGQGRPRAWSSRWWRRLGDLVESLSSGTSA